MKIEIYSECLQYIREEYKYFLPHFLNKKKYIFSFFLNILETCYDIRIQKTFTTICSFKTKKIFFVLFTEVH